MLRRALSTTKQFGMCVSIDNNEYASYGCMLEIVKAQFLRDGRALIETIGGRRFKIIRKSMKDGYNTADVEWLSDTKTGEIESKNIIKFSLVNHLLKMSNVQYNLVIVYPPKNSEKTTLYSNYTIKKFIKKIIH